MLIAAKSQVEIEKLKAQLSKEFEMKDLGEAKKILGIEINRDRERGKLWLSQKQYLQKVLQRFCIHEDTKPVSTPLAPHLKLSSCLSPTTDEEREYMAKVPICKCSWKLDVCNGVYKTRYFTGCECC